MNLKCEKCGLVNFSNTSNCKRCNHLLPTETKLSSRNITVETTLDGKNQLANLNGIQQTPTSAWGCFQILMLFLVAATVTVILSLYTQQFLPSGLYPTIVLLLIFAPAGIVGVVCGSVVFFALDKIGKLFNKS